MDKKLFRSKTDKKIAGVCGGLGTYLDIDSTVIRVLWVITIMLGGTGVMAYIICALIIPDEPEQMPYDTYYNVPEDKE